MNSKHRLVDLVDRLGLFRKKITKRIDQFLFVILFLAFSGVVYQIGFPKEPNITLFFNNILRQIPRIVMLLFLFRTILFFLTFETNSLKKRDVLPDVLFFMLLLLFDRTKHFLPLLESEFFLYTLLSLLFVLRFLREGSEIKLALLNPSILFVVSFVLLILMGTALLLIPAATNGNISFVDALFTATSAVCVTGLAVVDTSKDFTAVGQNIILILIQIGGLGLMTFTNFFSILFRGGMSFQSHLILQNIIETDKPNSLFKTLVKIIVYCAIIEILGSFFIYFSFDKNLFVSNADAWMFSTFHSISAFCNAGFSTLPNGLMHPYFQFNYNFQLIICFLIIFGGIGFPVIIDLYTFAKSLMISTIRTLFFKERFSFQARSINVHTRLVLSSTLLLLVVGTVIYYVTEAKSVLLDHPSTYGKIVQSFFGSVTPRTAGFNTVDMGKLTQATILIYLLLMWIGASPSSTGGGIKTTTFMIAIANIIALAKGKDRVDLFKREISSSSIDRAFAVVFLSMFVIGLGVFFISIFEPHLSLTQIAFECFSAYGTVGLSLNLTPLLSPESKIVLVIIMFIGRVGMFTLLVGVINKADYKSFRYPKENVLIT